MGDKERTRREDATRCVDFWRDRLLKMYTPLVANEMLSALFRQRGVPSVDCFTERIIPSFRVAMGFPPGVEDTLRRILKIGKWATGEYSMTMWTMEPVVASVQIRGNDVDLQTAVVETMEELDDGDGADRSALVETVADETGVAEGDVEDAIQDALMGGQCYEPDDETLKAI